ncbi:hypothetical protein H9P43_000931 [Blastocladiella emersonii ATCC 22665]|nr:hypothetical protein H9P43_000931 [Blastocladiella emersonii ATCC 22665]
MAAGSLYQQRELACIECSEPPRHLACVFTDKLAAIVAGDAVHLVPLASAHEGIVTLCSDADSAAHSSSGPDDPPCVAISPCSNFVVTAFPGGKVAFYHVPSGEYLLRYELGSLIPGFRIVKLEFSATAAGDDNELIVTGEQLILRVSHLRLAAFAAASSTADFPAIDAEIRKTVRMEQLQLPRNGHAPASSRNHVPPPCFTSSSALAPPSRSFGHVGEDGKALASIVAFSTGEPAVSLWLRDRAMVRARLHRSASWLTSASATAAPRVVVKSQVSADGRLLYVVDDQQRMSIWSLPHLIQLRHMEAVLDVAAFSPTPTTVGPRSRGTVAIMTSDNKFAVIDGAAKDLLAELAVEDPAFARLAVTASTVELVAPAAGLADARPDGPIVVPPIPLMLVCYRAAGGRSIRLLRYDEASPQAQLDTLLAAHAWDDALALAEEHLLDAQLVWRARLNSVARETISSFPAVVPLLDAVHDRAYRANVCFKLKFACIADQHAAFAYAERVLDELHRKDPSAESVAASLRAARDAMLRLGTWQLFGRDYDAVAVRDFLKCDLADMAQRLAAEGAIRDLAVVWSRHPALADTASALVKNLPLSVVTSELVQWLRHDVLPFAQPQIRYAINEWLVGRALKLEALPGRGAREALQLIDLIRFPLKVNSVAGVGSTSAWMAYMANATIAEPKPEVVQLGVDLDDLCFLDEKLGFKIRLDDYKATTVPLTRVAHLLLERIAAPERLPDTITNVFDPYVKRHLLNRDLLLAEHCDQVCTTFRRSAYAATWEQRVIVIQSFIGDIGIRCNIVLNLVSHAAVPCSDELADAVRAVLDEVSLAPADRDKLELAWRKAQLRQMLILDYRFPASVGFSPAQLRRVFGRLATISTIRAINDAIQIADAVADVKLGAVLSSFLTHHGSTMPHAQWTEYLRQLQQHSHARQFATVGRRLIAQIADNAFAVRHGPGNLTSGLAASERIANALALARFVQTVLERGDARVTAMIERLAMLQRLHVELKLTQATMASVHCAGSRLAFFLEHSATAGRAPYDVHRLANVLAIDMPQAYATMARQALQRGNVSESLVHVAEMMRLWCSVPLLLSLLRDLLHVAAEHPARFSSRLASGLLNIVERSMQLADLNLAPEILDHLRYTHLLCTVHTRSTEGEYRAVVGRTSLTASGPPQASSFASASAASSSSSSSAPAMTNGHDRILETRPSTNPSELHHHYEDNGFLLKSDIFLPMCIRLVLAGLDVASATSPRALLDELHAMRARKKSKGKGRSGPSLLAKLVQASDELVRALLDAEHVQLPLLVAGIVSDTTTTTLPSVASTEPAPATRALTADSTRARLLGLLKDMIRSPHVDLELAFSYLARVSIKKVGPTIINALQELKDGDLGKVHAYCALGVLLARHDMQYAAADTLRNHSLAATWQSQFALLGIPTAKSDFQRFHSDPNARTAALAAYIRPLLRASNMDLVLALEFAEAFHLNEDLVRLEFVRQQLAGDTQQPDAMELDAAAPAGSSANHAVVVATAGSCSGGGGGTALSSSAFSYQDAILAVHDDIVNTAQLADTYCTALFQSDPYNYARIGFLCGMVQNLAQKDPFVIDRATVAAVGKYQEVITVAEKFVKPNHPLVDGEVQDAEANGWDAARARTRLNLHEIVSVPPLDALKYLCRIISPTSLAVMLQLAPMIGLSTNEIHASFAINAQAQNRSAFKFNDVMPSLKAIAGFPTGAPAQYASPAAADHDAASAAGKMLARSIATNIAKHCDAHEKIVALQFAVRCLESLPGASDDPSIAHHLSESRDALRRARAARTLISYQVPQLTPLLDDPSALIVTLYTSYRELQYEGANQVPAYLVAYFVGADLELNLRNIQLELIKSIFGTDVPAPAGLLPSAAFASIPWESDHIIKYMVDYGNIDLRRLRKFLEATISREEKELTRIMKLRALSIMGKVLPRDLIPLKLSPKDATDVALMHLHLRDLDSLGLHYLPNVFLKGGLELVQTLWMKHHNNPLVLQVVCNLCVDYKLKDTDLLSKALASLVATGHYEYLAQDLARISLAFRDIPNLTEIWRGYLLGVVSHEHPAAPADADGAAAMVPRWARAVAESMIRCPILLDMVYEVSTSPHDGAARRVLAPFAFKFLGAAAQHGLATYLLLIGCLPLDPAAAVAFFAEHNLPILIALECAHAARDLFRMATAMDWLFEFVHVSRAYAQLLGTPFLEPSLRYALRRGLIGSLVEELLQEGQHEHALHLAKFYLRETRAQVPDDADPVERCLALTFPGSYWFWCEALRASF